MEGYSLWNMLLDDNNLGPPSEKGDSMEKWECSICGYVYDPDVGDPDNDVDPGTPFEVVPLDWTCPQCGADKDAFARVEDLE